MTPLNKQKNIKREIRDLTLSDNDRTLYTNFGSPFFYNIRKKFDNRCDLIRSIAFHQVWAQINGREGVWRP